MRNILLTLSVVLLCIGCQKDDVDTGFKVSTKRVTLSHEAGEFTIEFNNSQYMTDTPDILIDYGIEQEYYTVNYEWLEVVEKTPRKATFRYQSNSFPRNRSAIIKVKNRYFSEFTEIKVEQEWVGEMPIEMEISNVNTRSFDINVEADADMYTIMSTGSVSLSTTMEEHELICLIIPGFQFLFRHRRHMLYFVFSIHVIISDIEIVEHELDVAEEPDVTRAPVIGIALDGIPHSVQNTLLTLKVP
jgi:hypothetical protein